MINTHAIICSLDTGVGIGASLRVTSLKIERITAVEIATNPNLPQTSSVAVRKSVITDG